MLNIVTGKLYVGSMLLMALIIPCLAFGSDEEFRSFHIGFLHPSGVDIAGYSSEKQITDDIYRFYTFGFPSLAAIGLNYYANGHGQSGINATVGAGIGSVAYFSLAYLWPIDKTSNLRLGAGYTTGVAYTGAYPVISYEHHFGV